MRARLVMPWIADIDLERPRRGPRPRRSAGIAEISGERDRAPVPGCGPPPARRRARCSPDGSTARSGLPGGNRSSASAGDIAEARCARCSRRLRAVDRGHRAVDQIVDADEVGDEAVRGPLVQRLGRPDLEYLPCVEDRDAVRQRQRLFLVVRHVDRGDAEFLLQLADFGAHLHADLGVEVRQRLVEQQDLRDSAPARARARRAAAGRRKADPDSGRRGPTSLTFSSTSAMRSVDLARAEILRSFSP